MLFQFCRQCRLPYLLAILAFAGGFVPVNLCSGASSTNLEKQISATVVMSIPGSSDQYGSRAAFCINAAGYFVTSLSTSVLEKGGPKNVAFCTAAGKRSVLQCRLIAADDATGVAIIKVTPSEPFPAIELAETTGGSGSFQLVTSRLAKVKVAPFVESHPRDVQWEQIQGGAISRIGTIGGAGEYCVGGPVLDDRGRAVGVVYGNPLFGAPSIIPVERIRKLLDPPIVGVAPGEVSFPTALANPTKITIGVLDSKDGAGYDVSLRLNPGTDRERTLAAAYEGHGTYTTNGPLIAKSVTQRQVDYLVSVQLKGKIIEQVPGSITLTDIPAEQELSANRSELERHGVLRLKLPGVVQDTAVAANGRILLCHMPGTRQVAVIDLSQPNLAGIVALPQQHAIILGGSDELLAVMPDQRLLERWSLATLAKLSLTTLPSGWRVLGAGIGSDSRGPLFVITGNGGGEMVDPSTLVAQKVRGLNPPDQWPLIGSSYVVRVSADGHDFAVVPGRGGGSGLDLFALRDATPPREVGASVEHLHAESPVRRLTMDPECTFIYGDRDVYTHQLEVVPREKSNTEFVQAASDVGPFFLEFKAKHTGGAQEGPEIGLCRADTGQQVLSMPAMPELSRTGFDSLNRSPVELSKAPLERRCLLFVQSNLLATIGEGGNEVVLRRFEIDRMLRASGQDFLYVSSAPPHNCRNGETFGYRPSIKSSRGGVRVTLSSGPDGMTCSSDGAISWKVPASAKRETHTVLISIADASGKEIFNSFNLSVR